MSIGPLASSLLQSVSAAAFQGLGLTGNSSKTAGATSVTQQPDSSQLSPFAQVMNTLQQLQQSNPTQYQQVTQQIATNLQSAAQSATTNGNTAAASQLTQLSTDFSNASTSNQLPNMKDIAQAFGGHHHHGHHAADGDSSGTSSTASTSSSASSNSISQMLAAFQASASQNSSLNPQSIIMNALSNAGLSS